MSVAQPIPQDQEETQSPAIPLERSHCRATERAPRSAPAGVRRELAPASSELGAQIGRSPAIYDSAVPGWVGAEYRSRAEFRDLDYSRGAARPLGCCAELERRASSLDRSRSLVPDSQGCRPDRHGPARLP